MHLIEYDKTCGIIRCRIEGFLTDGEINEVIESAKTATATCNLLNGDIKALVTTDGQVQSIKAMEMVATQRESDVGIYDRYAFVVPTSLQKLQLSRVFNLKTAKYFISESAAILWLLADREHRVPQVEASALR